MAYEKIVFFKGRDADPFFEALLSKGPEGFLEELKIYHVEGQHPVVSEHQLNYETKDPFLRDGRYLAWWNVKSGYVGIAYQLFH